MGRKNIKALRLVFFLLLFAAACKKDKPGEVKPPVSPGTDNQAYIVCEGSLGNGNSSMGIYDIATGTMYDDAYKSANSRDLGDVFQSITPIGDQLFLCVNNSDKIVVISKTDHKEAGVINVSKPRYILPLGNDKAYVSSLFSNKVHIINTSTLQVTGSISMPAQNPEEMLLHNGKVYITTWDTASDKVYVIDPATDKIEREITIAGRAPQGITEDKDGNIWVLSGNVTKGKSAAITKFDPASGIILQQYKFPANADPMRAVFNETKDVLYFIEVNYNGGTEYNGIYRMPVTADKLPETPFIQAEKLQYFWALGIQPASGKIFVGDPKGFIQKGVVTIYDADGNRTGQFETGVGPGHFYFQ